MATVDQLNARPAKTQNRLSRIKFHLPSLLKRNSGLLESNHLTSFLTLPVELQVLVLNYLSITDLLSLRLSSKSLCEVVSSCSPYYVRNHIRHDITRLQLTLYPSPPPGAATLRWLLDMQHRIHTSRALARFLCDHSTRHLAYWKPHRRSRVHERSYQVMVRHLTPLIFTLNHFFEEYRRMILERAMKNWDPTQEFQITTGGPTVWYDQVSILSRYSPTLMLECYGVYGSLLQALDAQFRAHKVRRLWNRYVRGLGKWDYMFSNSAPVEVLLVLGGFDQVQRVLQKKNYHARRVALVEFIERLKPQGGDWMTQWRELNVASDAVNLDKVPNLRLRLPALHLVWVPSALKLLLEGRVINRVDFGGSTARNLDQGGDFIGDLMAYQARRFALGERSEDGDGEVYSDVFEGEDEHNTVTDDEVSDLGVAGGVMGLGNDDDDGI